MKKFFGILISLSLITSCSNQTVAPNLSENTSNQIKTSSDDVLNYFFKDSIARLFRDLDDNKDNKLSSSEVENAIWDEKFRSLDKNKDSFLSLDEALSNKSSLISNELEMRKRAEEKFKIVDKNRDLFIDFNELSNVYKKDPDETDNNKIKAIGVIFQSVDYAAASGNKDGKLSLEEFENFMYIFPLSFSSIITKKFPEIFS